MYYRDISPEDAQQELAGDATLKLLDVRTAPEHRSYRLRGAALLPVQDLATRLGELDPNANWLVYCEHGWRSLSACQILAQAGFSKLANLRGGIAQWVGKGLPVER